MRINSPLGNSPLEKSPVEKNFDVFGLKLAALQWGNPQGKPVIALHGWVDNCASFSRLAPLLPELNLVALDLAGHGHSGRRSADSWYNIWQDTAEILAVADLLGWDHFSLLGHSRGAVIAMLTAAACPERISRLALIDGLVPFPARRPSPQQLGKAIADKKRFKDYQRRTYASLEAIAETRMSGQIPLSREAARLIAERGADKIQGGYQWRADPRLQGASELHLTREQVKEFLCAVSCPTKIIMGSRGLASVSTEEIQPALEANPLFSSIVLEGGHHLHLEEQAGDVAAVLDKFLGLDQP